jgi:hypothetical protein
LKIDFYPNFRSVKKSFSIEISLSPMERSKWKRANTACKVDLVGFEQLSSLSLAAPLDL